MNWSVSLSDIQHETKQTRKQTSNCWTSTWRAHLIYDTLSNLLARIQDNILYIATRLDKNKPDLPESHEVNLVGELSCLPGVKRQAQFQHCSYQPDILICNSAGWVTANCHSQRLMLLFYSRFRRDSRFCFFELGLKTPTWEATCENTTSFFQTAAKESQVSKVKSAFSQVAKQSIP